MKTQGYWQQQIKKHSVLSPVDRIAEVLFGLIMVLTFTGTISVSSDGKEEIRELLWAALGCNLAWGLVDAIMYLMNVSFDRGYSSVMLKRIRKSTSKLESITILRSELQPVVAELMDDEDIIKLEQKMKSLPETPNGILLTGSDFYAGFKIFLLVFICTLPVALPFGIFSDPVFALQVSNGVALLLLFLGGYQLARYSGYKPILTAFVYMLIGVFLVALTMAFGG
jgi:VIT1/CCC1 family predicted Fe2+/Mn2+ transporter